MGIEIPGKVVVFDYGEVISPVPSGRDRDELMRLAGAEREAFWQSYWHHRDAVDVGAIDVREYWARIRRDVKCDWDEALMHRLWLADFRGWLALDEGTLDLLVELKAGNTRMALLSNAGPDFVSYYRHGMIGGFFEKVFVSSEVGILKPDRRIFDAMLAGLSIEARDVIFVDDRASNIEGAEAIGITGHRFTDPATLRVFLEDVARCGASTDRRGVSGVSAL